MSIKKLAMENNGSYESIPHTEVISETNGTKFVFTNGNIIPLATEWYIFGGSGSLSLGSFPGFSEPAKKYQSYLSSSYLMNDDDTNSHPLKGKMSITYTSDVPVDIKVHDVVLSNGQNVGRNDLVHRLEISSTPITVDIPYDFEDYTWSGFAYDIIKNFTFHPIFSDSNWHSFIFNNLYTDAKEILSWDSVGNVNADGNVNIGGDLSVTSTLNASNIELTSTNGIKNTSNTNYVWNDVGTEGYSHCVAIGYYSRTHSYNGVAIGRSANAYGNTSVALGYSSYAAGNYSTAVGYGAKTTYDYASAFGRGADALAKYSTAIGYNSYVTAQHEMRLGYSSTTVKLGNGSTVTSDERDKTEISENELGLEFINNVKTFKWKDNNRDKYFKTEIDKETGVEKRILDENGLLIIDEEKHQNGDNKGKRWHRGIVAQELMKQVDSNDFSAVKDTTINNEQPHLEEMTVDYLQFIAPMIKSIQQLSERIESLEKENNKLKEKK